MSRPEMPSSFESNYGNDYSYNPEKNFSEKELENLNPRTRMMIEIEKLLNMHGGDLKLKTIRSNKDTHRIYNTDIYKLYKSLLNVFDVSQSIVYTGSRIMTREEAQEIVDDLDENIDCLERSK